MKPLHADNVDKFSDALENIVVLLRTQGTLNELQPNSSLYMMPLEKTPEEMLSQYYRWLGERLKPETLEVFKDWILDETGYRVKAAEATCIKGLKQTKFKALHTDDRWKKAKVQALCFRCRSNTHKGSSCRRFR